MNVTDFLERLQEFYVDNKRDLPWRQAETDGSFDPYKILVSEFMLQQTQVDRVRPKYSAFIQQFPSMEELSRASFSDVTNIWSGLGYNRRARYLYDCSRNLADKPFPDNIDELTEQKGIGHNSAAAILTYAFNQRHIFIETNIRTVFLYEFFANHDEKVTDNEIESLLRECVFSVDSPREFYWALMDYGSWLKKQGIRNNAQSQHYKKQSKFEGSLRQLRGEVLRRAQKGQLQSVMIEEVADERIENVIASLSADGLIELKQGCIVIKNT